MPSTVSPAPRRRTPGPVVFIVGLFFTAVGVAMPFAVGKRSLQQREFLTHSERTTGTVVDFKTRVVTSSNARGPAIPAGL